MSTTQLIVVALIAIMAGLWVRRTTWSYRWEKGATLNLAGIGIYLVCSMPAAAPAYYVLYHLTRTWNVEDLIGLVGRDATCAA